MSDASKKNNQRPRTCHNCGRGVRLSDVYCPACGCKLDDDLTAHRAQTGTVGASGDDTPTGRRCARVTHSRTIASLLAFFLGTLGLHNFYLGYYAKAVWQLVISVVFAPFTCGLSTGIVFIWSCIEGALILSGSVGFDVDAQGNFLGD